MNKIDLVYLCTVIGNLAGIPIRWYKNRELQFYQPFVELPKDPITPYLDKILSIEKHISYFVTPHFNYYGVVSSENDHIVIGPSRQLLSSETELREIAFEANVPKEDTETFIRGMKSITTMPLESIMQILCAMNYILNDEKLFLTDIIIFDSYQVSNSITQAKNDAVEKYNRYISGEQPIAHNTLAIEKSIMKIITAGDTDALMAFTKNSPAVRPGTLAVEPLRQTKNTFIVTTSLAARAAIRGGMDSEDALSFSDKIIQQCELLQSSVEILNLMFRMIKYYTESVAKLRRGKTKSKLITDVTNYILHHLSDAIRTEDLAKALFMSRQYLSGRFREETGTTLTDFILKEKITEAKRLLLSGDKSLLAISTYLGFSSQSHFSRVFKKYEGITPTKFRLKL